MSEVFWYGICCQESRLLSDTVSVRLYCCVCELCSYDYVLAREYNWNVKNKASRGYEENYFFVMKEDGVYYNELETR